MPETTVTVFDTAAYIYRKYAPMAKDHGDMDKIKLQKLVYYSQAWSLVFDDEPLFGEPIEAWDVRAGCAQAVQKASRRIQPARDLNWRGQSEKTERGATEDN